MSILTGSQVSPTRQQQQSPTHPRGISIRYPFLLPLHMMMPSYARQRPPCLLFLLLGTLLLLLVSTSPASATIRSEKEDEVAALLLLGKDSEAAGQFQHDEVCST